MIDERKILEKFANNLDCCFETKKLKFKDFLTYDSRISAKSDHSSIWMTRDGSNRQICVYATSQVSEEDSVHKYLEMLLGSRLHLAGNPYLVNELGLRQDLVIPSTLEEFCLMVDLRAGDL